MNKLSTLSVYLQETSLSSQLSLPRTLKNGTIIFISSIAFAWTVFQLLIATVLTLDDIVSKAVHLTFALILLFAVMPIKKQKDSNPPISLNKKNWIQRFFHSYGSIPLLDVLLCILSVFAVLYLPVNLQELSLRAGNPQPIDILMGSLFVIIVLEASRRSVGLPMTILVIVLALWAFFGTYMPRPFDFQSVSLNKFMEKVSVSTEGIFGIPLYVATYTVFLFVLFGTLLERFGAGQFFNDVAIAMLGRYRGGPAKAAVISSGLSGMVSGSSIANVVTTGTVTIPLMKKAGFPARIAAATEVAASTNGQLMPPIMGAAAFIIAEYIGIGYSSVVRAAIIPAITSYIALFYIVHLEAYKLNLAPLKSEYIPNLWKVFSKGWYQLIPILVLITLLVMRFSPSLSVTIAIFTLLATMYVKEIVVSQKTNQSTGKNLLALTKTSYFSLVQGAINMIPVTLATAAAGIIVGIVNMGIGGLLIQIVEQISFGNFFLLLFFIAMFSLLIGMGLPTTATYIVMATITVPIMKDLGALYGFGIPLIAAHLYCFYFGIIADDTPPVGLAAYAAAAIAKTNPIPVGITGFVYDLRTAVIPFVFVLNPIFILEGVTGLVPSLAVFAIAVLGGLTFTNFIQGYFIIKNKWYESVLLLATSALFYLSRVFVVRLQEMVSAGSESSIGFFQNFVIEHPFGTELVLYGIAFVLYGVVFILQRIRKIVDLPYKEKANPET